MHLSSLDNMREFVAQYLEKRRDDQLTIVDLGSQNIGGSYRQFFDCPGWSYIGVDVAAGPNVDLVLDDPYNWGELKSDSVDVLVSGQVFEHIEYFWLTMAEIRRVLKPGGLCCIIAPSGGREHRYPVDCWRFYPDGLRAMARYVDMEVISAVTNWNAEGYADDSAVWADSVLVARKPEGTSMPEAVATSQERETAAHIYSGDNFLSDDTALARIAALVTADSRVLELGPATGYFTRHLSEQLRCRVDCVELCPDMACRAEKFCDTMLVADLDVIRLEEHFERESYDYIIAADVLEHLRQPEEILRAARKLLKPQGKLLLSVPNVAHAAVVGSLMRDRFDYRDEGLLDRSHVHFFTATSLETSLQQAALSVVHREVVSRLPEETEIDDDFGDLPQPWQQILQELPNALSYQFIVAATPTPLAELAVADNAAESGDFSSRRTAFHARLRAEIQRLEQALAQMTDAFNSQKEEYASIVERHRQLSDAMAQAQQLALQRLEQVQTLDAALRQAQEFVRTREQEVAELTQENAALSARLKAIEDSPAYKAYRAVKSVFSR